MGQQGSDTAHLLLVPLSLACQGGAQADRLLQRGLQPLLLLLEDTDGLLVGLDGLQHRSPCWLLM